MGSCQVGRGTCRLPSASPSISGLTDAIKKVPFEIPETGAPCWQFTVWVQLSSQLKNLQQWWDAYKLIDLETYSLRSISRLSLNSSASHPALKSTNPVGVHGHILVLISWTYKCCSLPASVASNRRASHHITPSSSQRQGLILSACGAISLVSVS